VVAVLDIVAASEGMRTHEVATGRGSAAEQGVGSHSSGAPSRARSVLSRRAQLNAVFDALHEDE